jgi:RimJ/RimL family protein N-acetyltransferase
MFTTVQTEQDVKDILALQALNHKSTVSEETWQSQGFVTVRHDFDVLWDMNRAYPSVIARAANNDLVGYCLMMPRSFSSRIPILEPMFTKLEQMEDLRAQRWFVMGQICVAEAYRGQGVFDGMYQHLREIWKNDFDLMITEISERNPRSLRAHERVGFQTFKEYENPHTGEKWHLVALKM